MKPQDISDFHAFLNADSTPPAAIEKQLFSKIQTALNPPLAQTVAKLFGVHLVGSFLTLLLCPQFGIGLESPISKFTMWLMNIHPALCFIMCGCLWMIGGQAAASSVLTIDERRVSGKYQLGTVFSQIVLVLIAFGCVGLVTFDQWLGWWLFGAVSAGVSYKLVVEWKQKRRRLRISHA